MAALLNARWERFAQEIANGQPMVRGYVEAGFKHDRANAQRLRNRDDIRLRVDELLAERATIQAEATSEMVNEIALDRKWVIDTLQAVVAKGFANGDLGPVIRAAELIGKAVAPGIFTEHISTVTNANADVDSMTDDESRAEWARLVAEGMASGAVVPLDGGKAGGLAQPPKRKALA